jgi:hypothetical protein
VLCCAVLCAVQCCAMCCCAPVLCFVSVLCCAVAAVLLCCVCAVYCLLFAVYMTHIVVDTVNLFVILFHIFSLFSCYLARMSFNNKGSFGFVSGVIFSFIPTVFNPFYG